MSINDGNPKLGQWVNSTIPNTTAAKIRAYRDTGTNDVYITGQGFTFLVLDNQSEYPRGQHSGNGDCYGYVFENGKVVLYTWSPGPHNSPPPCGV